MTRKIYNSDCGWRARDQSIPSHLNNPLSTTVSRIHMPMVNEAYSRVYICEKFARSTLHYGLDKRIYIA